jgi:hypothetical protein
MDNLETLQRQEDRGQKAERRIPRDEAVHLLIAWYVNFINGSEPTSLRLQAKI